MKSFCIALVLLLLVPFGRASAEDTSEDLLRDLNVDGAVTLLAFGDSITSGTGDGFQPGQYIEGPLPHTKGGYPKAISTRAGVPVANSGIPGEELSLSGADRFARVVSGSNADVVLFLEGTNDGIAQANAATVRNKLQRVVNVALALGKKIVLMSLPPTCCNHFGQKRFLDSYNIQIERLVGLNGVSFADLSRAFRTSCENPEECELLNVPEGLHPNSKGYAVISDTILGTLYGIDVFSASGPAELAQALGVDPSEISVKPDPVTVGASNAQ